MLGQVGVQGLRLLPLAHLRGDRLPINLLRQGVQLRQPLQGLLAGQPALGGHRDDRPVPAELAEEVAPPHLLEGPVHVVHHQLGVGDAHGDALLAEPLPGCLHQVGQGAHLRPLEALRVVPGAVGHVGDGAAEQAVRPQLSIQVVGVAVGPVAGQDAVVEIFYRQRQLLLPIQGGHVKGGGLLRRRDGPGQLLTKLLQAGHRRSPGLRLLRGRVGGGGLLRPVQPQVLPDGGAQSRHVRVGPEEVQLLLGYRVPLGNIAQHKDGEGVGDVLVEVVGPVAAHIAGGVGLVVPHAGVPQPAPEGVIKILPEGALHKGGRVVGAGALAQVNLGLVLQQDVAVLVENGVGQLAPVPLFSVLVVHVVVVDADGEAGVVGDVPLLDRRGVGQDVAGTVGEQAKFGDLLPGLQGEDGAQEVPHRPVLRVGDAGLAAAHRVGGEHVGDAQAVAAHGDQTALLVRGEGDVLAVYRVGPADLAILLPLRRAVHGLDEPPDLLRGAAGLLRADDNALQEAVAVLVVGVHGDLSVKPAHGVAVGLIGVGPAVSGDLPAVRQLPGRADVGLGVRAGAAEIDHVLPGLAVGVPLPLRPGQFPVGGGIRGADLRRRFHRRLRRGGNGVQVQLVGRVRRRVVQIALPVLHQQDGWDPGQLEGGVVAGRLRPPLQGRVLLLEQVADPVGLPVHGTHQGAVRAQAAQHVKLDVADHPVLLLL